MLLVLSEWQHSPGKVDVEPLLNLTAGVAHWHLRYMPLKRLIFFFFVLNHLLEP